MDAVFKHPDYKASMQAKNADYLAYQDLKQVCLIPPGELIGAR